MTKRSVLVGINRNKIRGADLQDCISDVKNMQGIHTTGCGQPFGVDEIQDQMVWTHDNGFPEKLRGEWVNVFDPFNLVSRLDSNLDNEFRKSGPNRLTGRELPGLSGVGRHEWWI